MLTLTIDPKLFPSPAAALDHIRRKHAIGEFVKALRKEGCLHSRRYFCAIEWQKNGMPHFHLLLDASRIDIHTARRLWNRFYPTSAPPIEESDAGFGWVKYSAAKTADKMKAAKYVCKYLIKHPDEGFPDWVLDSENNIVRYYKSHGLWGETAGPQLGQEAEEPGPHDPACECESCQKESSSKENKPQQQRRTIRDRLSSCGQGSVIFEVTPHFIGDDEVRFLENLSIPFHEVQRRLGIPEGQRRVRISRSKLAELRCVHFGKESP
ncbi:rolling circle replication-associated protein [Lignipirellula cremea]|nr:hypothetical protein [Lignipirellula cremea]